MKTKKKQSRKKKAVKKKQTFDCTFKIFGKSFKATI